MRPLFYFHPTQHPTMKKLALLGALIFIAACQKPSEPQVEIDPYWSIMELDEKLSEGEITSVQLTQFYLNRILRWDVRGHRLKSIISVNPEAIQIARELDKERAQGKTRSPLHGIPVILKDNIETLDSMPTTAGSRALKESYVARDARLVKRLRDAGAIILAKANLSEWANFRGQRSVSGWSGYGGLTRNPYDLSRNPCGSSSGSAVAVAAGFAPLSIGTETNGSIICPAQSNGLVGLKPTVGLVSRQGVIPISHSQDSPGPMARSVMEVALALRILQEDEFSELGALKPSGKREENYPSVLNVDSVKGMRIGIYREASGADARVDSLFEAAQQVFADLGCELLEIEPIMDRTVYGASFEVMLYEYKYGLNQYFANLPEHIQEKTGIANLEDLIAYNRQDSLELEYFGQEYLEMAQTKGTLSDSSYRAALARAQRGSRSEGINRIMTQYELDAIIAPSGAPAWETDLINGDHFILGSSGPAAIAGYPNISLPMGFVQHMPVGISIFSGAFREADILKLAYAYEQKTKHWQKPDYKR